MTEARSDPRPVERIEGLLRWIKLPGELELWHLAFNNQEAICGQHFSLRIGWVSRTFGSGPPPAKHAACQDELMRRIGLA